MDPKDVKTFLIAMLTLVAGWILKDIYLAVKKKMNQPAERDESLDAKIDDLREEFDERMMRLEQDAELQKNAHLCTHRNDLIRDCEKYLEDKEITEVHYESLSEMYHSYKALGGNHSVDKYWTLIEKLPIVISSSVK